MVNIDSFNIKPISTKQKKSRIKPNNIFIILSSTLIILLLFSSIFYSKKVLNNIEEKKESIFKLKKMYHKIQFDNEKINILISKLKNNNYKDKQLLKIMNDFQFTQEAENLKKNYNDKYYKTKSSNITFWSIMGIITLVVIRLLSIEVLNNRIIKKNKK